MKKENALKYLHELFGTTRDDIKKSIENQNISHFSPGERFVRTSRENQKLFLGRIWILSGTGVINFLLNGVVVHQIQLNFQNFDENLNIVCDEIDASKMEAGLLEVSFLSFDLIDPQKKNDEEFLVGSGANIQNISSDLFPTSIPDLNGSDSSNVKNDE